VALSPAFQQAIDSDGIAIPAPEPLKRFPYQPRDFYPAWHKYFFHLFQELGIDLEGSANNVKNSRILPIL
jgi:hypothetical protein